MKKILIALLMLVAHLGQAAVLSVSNTNDSGVGSLRQSITNAINGDIINISLTGTITLASELPMITQSITINGNSAGTTISGNNVCRVFTVNISTGTVTLNNLNVINGYTTSGNSSGMSAITDNNGKVVVNNSSFSNCTATGSQAYGGAISVSADLDLNNCTINNCSADTGGGALASLDVTTINILNCTIVNNHSTDPTGGGGIDLYAATVKIKNTILANNTSGPTHTLANSVLTTSMLTSLGYNLSDDNGGFVSVAGDLMNKNFASEIKLDALANNGGPVQTCAIQVGSLAIDATSSVLTTDARGYGRYHNADIGAYEYHGIPPSLMAPVTQASGIAFTGVTSTTIPITWTRGSGVAVAVFVHQGTASNALPVEYATYTANAVFKSGSQLGTSGWYCVFNSSGTGVTITGLTAETDYVVQVIEYNGIASYEKYNSGAATDNPKSQKTLGIPVISVLSPTIGSISGGTSVTLIGTNLANATAVSFGSTAATFTANSATSITATSPSGSVGAIHVTVTTAGGISAISSSDLFTYVAAPIATTQAVSNITSTGATLKGSINANNASTVVTFEYGLTTSYGTSVTADQNPLTGTTATEVSKDLSDLTPNTTYYFRVKGINTEGTAYGLIQSFTTDMSTELEKVTSTFLSLYPNPTIDGFYIHTGEQANTVSIYNVSGSLVLTQHASGTSYINIRSLQQGVYVVKVNGRVGKLVKR